MLYRDDVAFLITTEIAETTEMSGRDISLYNNAFFKKALLYSEMSLPLISVVSVISVVIKKATSSL